MNTAVWMLSGAITLGWLLAGLFFLRFWRQTRDAFFLYFTAAFWLEAVTRLVAALLVSTAEDEPLLYAIRLLAYALVIAAIWHKNRPRIKPPGS
jgi:hypothetical protein